MGEREEQIVARLVSKLKSDNEFERNAAVGISRRIHGGEFVVPLLTVIETEQDSDTYFTLLDTLSDCSDRWAIAPLFAIVINKQAPLRMRARALNTLIVRDPAVAAELAISLLKDGDGRMRFAAGLVLGSLSSEDSYLNQRIGRNLHAEMLKALGDDGSERIVDALISALEDKNVDVRRTAVNTLRIIGSQKAVPPLIAAVKGQYERVRYHAIKALGKCGEAGIQALIALLEDEDKGIRTSAAIVLGGLGNKQAISVLIEVLEDEAMPILAQATVLLTQMDAAFRPRLIEMLNSPEPKVRREIARAMEEFPDKREAELLAEHIMDVDVDAGLLAAWALREADQPRLIALLCKMLQSEDINMRKRAALVLDGTDGVYGSTFAHLTSEQEEQLIAALRPLLNDADWELRLSAMSNIDIHEEEPTRKVEALIAGLRDESSEVRKNAADRIDSPEANDILIGLLNDESAQVRESAVRALYSRGDERAIPPLLSMIENDGGLDSDGNPLSDVAKKAVTLIKTREYILTGKEL